MYISGVSKKALQEIKRLSAAEDLCAPVFMVTVGDTRIKDQESEVTINNMVNLSIFSKNEFSDQDTFSIEGINFLSDYENDKHKNAYILDLDNSGLFQLIDKSKVVDLEYYRRS